MFDASYVEIFTDILGDKIVSEFVDLYGYNLKNRFAKSTPYALAQELNQPFKDAYLVSNSHPPLSLFAVQQCHSLVMDGFDQLLSFALSTLTKICTVN